MKRTTLLLVASVAVLTSACSSTRIARENAAGDKFTAKNTRWLWKSEGIDVQFSSQPDGSVTASAKIKSSGQEADALRDAAREVTAALKGAVK